MRPERLADAVYLCAISDIDGRRRTSKRVQSLAVASAVFGELMARCKVTIDSSGALWPKVDTEPPGEYLANAVWLEIAKEQKVFSASDWATALGTQILAEVGRRVAEQGFLEPVMKYNSRGEQVIDYIPVDLNVAATPLVGIRHQIRDFRPLRTDEAVVAGLVMAAGLTSHLLQYLPRSRRVYRHVTNQVSALHPAWRTLIGQLQLAVDSAIAARL